MLAISFWDIVGWHVISQKCHLIPSARFVIKTNRMLVSLSNIPPNISLSENGGPMWALFHPMFESFVKHIQTLSYPSSCDKPISNLLVMYPITCYCTAIVNYLIFFYAPCIWGKSLMFDSRPFVVSSLDKQTLTMNWWGYPQNCDNLPSKLLPLLFDGLAVFYS